MNTMLVYFLMLKPALLAGLLLLGVPLAIGAWLLPYLRARKNKKFRSSSHLSHATVEPMIGFGP